MIAVLILTGFVAAGLLIGFRMTATAPVGFQDADGFHYGPDQEAEAHDFPVAVAEAKAA